MIFFIDQWLRLDSRRAATTKVVQEQLKRSVNSSVSINPPGAFF